MSGRRARFDEATQSLLTFSDKTIENEKQQKKSLSTTNILLSLIAFFTFIQSVIVFTAGISGIVFYGQNKDKIEAWSELPWDEMAHTVEKTYQKEKETPITGTIQNAFYAANELKETIQHHKDHTLPHIEHFANELSKHKNTFHSIYNLSEATLPAVKQIHTALGHRQVHDITGILHKTNKVMNLIESDKKETQTNYRRGTTLIDQVNNLMHPENVKKTIAAVDKISTALDTTLTADNVNKTMHVISDFDNSLHKAESRLSKIGKIFGNI